MIGIVCQPRRYPAKGHALSDSQNIFHSWNVYTPELQTREGLRWRGVFIVAETYAVKCALGTVGDGGAGYLEGCLVGIPDSKQATTFVASEPLGDGTG